MAYVQDQEKEQNKLNMGQPVTSGGQQGTSVVSGGQGPVQGRPTSSGRFTNIQNYINANRGSNIGQQVQQNIASQAGKTQSEINKEREDFQQKTSQAMQPFQGGQEFAQQAIQNAGQNEMSDADMQRFQALRKGNYAGPTDLSNYSALSNQAQNVKQLANLGNTESGRFALLKNVFGGGPQYGRGAQTLDSLILQKQNPQLQQMKTAASKANTALEVARSQAQQQAQTNTQQASDIAKNVGTQLTGAQTGLETDLQNKLGAARTQQDDIYNRLQKQVGDISKTGPTEIDEDLYNRLQAGLGISENAPLYNAGILPFVNKSVDPTLQTIANTQDYAKYKALQNLAGTQGTLLNDPTMAGEYERTGPLMFNKDPFQATVKQGEEQYTTDPSRNQALTHINRLNELQREQGLIGGSLKGLLDIYNNPDYQKTISTNTPDKQSPVTDYSAANNQFADQIKSAVNLTPNLSTLYQGTGSFTPDTWVPSIGLPGMIGGADAQNTSRIQGIIDQAASGQITNPELLQTLYNLVSGSKIPEAWANSVYGVYQPQLQQREQALGKYQTLKKRLGA